MGVLSLLFTDVSVDVPLGETPALVLAALERRIAAREIRGEVEQSRIRLSLRGMLPHRPYQPAFTGLLDTSVSPMRLRGRIQTPGILKLSIWWWLGFCVLWTVGALVATRSDDGLQWMPLVGLLMLVFGYGFFSLVNRFVAGLARTLETIIRDTVAKSPNKSFERTRER
jgi:hypothetical protein